MCVCVRVMMMMMMTVLEDGYPQPANHKFAWNSPIISYKMDVGIEFTIARRTAHLLIIIMNIPRMITIYD